MAGGANAAQRLASVEMRPHGIQLLFGRSAAAEADEEQVRIVKRLDQAGKVVLVLRVGLDDRNSKAFRLQFRFGELRQGFPCLIFVLADHKDQAGTSRLRRLNWRAKEHQPSA